MQSIRGDEDVRLYRCVSLAGSMRCTHTHASPSKQACQKNMASPPLRTHGAKKLTQDDYIAISNWNDPIFLLITYLRMSDTRRATLGALSCGLQREAWRQDPRSMQGGTCNPRRGPSPQKWFHLGPQYVVTWDLATWGISALFWCVTPTRLRVTRARRSSDEAAKWEHVLASSHGCLSFKVCPVSRVLRCPRFFNVMIIPLLCCLFPQWLPFGGALLFLTFHLFLFACFVLSWAFLTILVSLPLCLSLRFNLSEGNENHT